VTDPKPKLVAVDPAQNTGDSRPAPQKRRRWTDLGVGFWVVAVILIIAAAFIAAQTRQLDELSNQVATLETELNVANSALRGYENRFGEIRTAVGDLRAQVGELEGLVEQPPRPAPPR
jgi:uncharacterized coiled-coil protein SlyX